MDFNVTIPDEFIEPLHAAVGKDLGRAAVEQLALEGYRAQQLTFYQVQQLLGFNNRWETERWLGSRGASLNYSLEELEEDRETLDGVLGSSNS